MPSIFNPTGKLNVSWDASDLPGEVSGNSEVSGAMTRCKNLRTNQNGKLVTRNGSQKLNTTAIDGDFWWIQEMSTTGVRYSFSGGSIYRDEVGIASDLTSAQWSAIHYNSFNDTTNQLFALNGTDRKRVEGSSVYEWGLDAPTVAPTLTTGGGSGLTGQYNAKYTYVRKVGTAIVAESNPSPAAATAVVLNNQSLAIRFTQPSDPQVTHVRIYRTLAGGSTYYLDLEKAIAPYDYGYTWAWEKDGAYISGTGYKFTVTDASRVSENTYTWEATFEDREDQDSGDQPTYDDIDTIPWWKWDVIFGDGGLYP